MRAGRKRPATPPIETTARREADKELHLSRWARAHHAKPPLRRHLRPIKTVTALDSLISAHPVLIAATEMHEFIIGHAITGRSDTDEDAR